jgi:hypothetical protein
MCSPFAKPALTALYRNPPIFALRQNRIPLVELLATPFPQSESFFVDYSVMVKRLELDATRMSNLTRPQTSVDSLVALISSLRTVKDIDIIDPSDKPPYRERTRSTRRWYYPDELFDALSHSEIRLQSWRWHSTYCAKGPLWIKDVHNTATFQSLREVNLTKFHSAASKKAEEAPSREELLGSALAVLPKLRSLTFETCLILNGRLLPLLPNNLSSMNITNCRNLVSEDLQSFLTTHGNHLEDLVLNHNQSLDLSFLTSLKQHCPRLEVLRMDMHYYNTITTTSDNEPLYDALLIEGETPTWPSTLRVIDLEYLRNWTAQAAIDFFQSLIDSAKELPWLQEIIITAIVDIDWRQRAEFRKKWTSRFQKVFVRPWIPPNPDYVSLRAIREAEQRRNRPDERTTDQVEEGPGKVDTVPTADNAGSSSESDSDAPLISSRRRKHAEPTFDSKRLRSRGKAKYDESSGDDGETGAGEESDAEDVPFIQGNCNTVLFRVDNSRPQEQIYDEQDFLDDEVSGDEDWNGNDYVEDEYAW